MFNRKISQKRIKELNRIFAAFTFSKLQDLNSLICHMEQQKVSKKEFKKFLVAKQDRDLKKVREASIRPYPNQIKSECPKCSMPLHLFTVNSKSCEMVGGKWKTQLICEDWENCGYERFSIKTIDEWISGLTSVQKRHGGVSKRKPKRPCGSCNKKTKG